MRHVMPCLAACAALALSAAPVRAMRVPDLAIGAGVTTLVKGDPGNGGLSASLAAMWSVEPPLAVGLVVFADDCGSRLSRLKDMHDGTDLGTIEDRHRFAYGAGWRFDLDLMPLGRWVPYASATWGAYRVQDDVRGIPVHALTATGLSAGGGVRRAFKGAGALGATAQWHSVLRGPTTGWLSAGLDWQWRWGRRP